MITNSQHSGSAGGKNLYAIAGGHVLDFHFYNHSFPVQNVMKAFLSDLILHHIFPIHVLSALKPALSGLQWPE